MKVGREGRGGVGERDGCDRYRICDDYNGWDERDKNTTATREKLIYIKKVFLS